MNHIYIYINIYIYVCVCVPWQRLKQQKEASQQLSKISVKIIIHYNFHYNHQRHQYMLCFWCFWCLSGRRPPLTSQPPRCGHLSHSKMDGSFDEKPMSTGLVGLQVLRNSKKMASGIRPTTIFPRGIETMIDTLHMCPIWDANGILQITTLKSKITYHIPVCRSNKRHPFLYCFFFPCQ